MFYKLFPSRYLLDIIDDWLTIKTAKYFLGFKEILFMPDFWVLRFYFIYMGKIC